ncbi:MAG: Rab family GTPase [Promethearchaeota archaeon]
MCAFTKKRNLQFKIIVAGDGGVGKTTLLTRYVFSEFTSIKMTIGTDFFSKVVDIDDKIVRLQLWDFGGQERFRFMIPYYCEGAHGAILAFDMSDFATLMNLDEWLQIIKENTWETPIIFLVGTKADLPVFYDEDFIKEFCNNNGIEKFIATSAKTGENIERLFQELAKEIIVRRSKTKNA